MTMNRRSFIKGLVGATAAIVVPDLILPPEPEKRFWALDRTMMGTERFLGSGWIDARLEDFDKRFTHVTTIAVQHPERFRKENFIWMGTSETIFLDSIEPDGTFIIRYAGGGKLRI